LKGLNLFKVPSAMNHASLDRVCLHPVYLDLVWTLRIWTPPCPTWSAP